MFLILIPLIVAANIAAGLQEPEIHPNVDGAPTWNWAMDNMRSGYAKEWGWKSLDNGTMMICIRSKGGAENCQMFSDEENSALDNSL